VRALIKNSIVEESSGLPRVPLLTNNSDDGFPSWAKDKFLLDSRFYHVYGFREKAFSAAQDLGVAMLPDLVGVKVPGITKLSDIPCALVTQLLVLSNADVKTSLRIKDVKQFLIDRLKTY